MTSMERLAAIAIDIEDRDNRLDEFGKAEELIEDIFDAIIGFGRRYKTSRKNQEMCLKRYAKLYCHTDRDKQRGASDSANHRYTK